MKTEHPPKPQNSGEANSPAVSDDSVIAGHEVTDVNVLGLTLFGAGLAVSVVGILIVIALVFRIFGAVDRHLDKGISQHEPGAASHIQIRPNYTGPELQVTPEKDLMALHANDDVALETYGWIDKDKGVVRLPIDRAISLVAERGIPSTSPGHTLEEFQQQRAQPQIYGQALRP